jgi:drug/metabolite transporter (DMT)-like permease
MTLRAAFSPFVLPEYGCFMPGIAPSPDRILPGILLMLASMFLFSLNDVMGKWLVATYSVGQLLLIRSFGALLMMGPAIARRGVISIFKQDRPWLHVLRAATSTAEVAFFYWAVVYLPLADAVTFYLAGPIIVTLLAVLFLGEKVGWRRWLAIFIGFGGVVVAVNPSAASFSWPALIALAGSFLFAVLNITTRMLKGTDEVSLVTWQIVAALLFGLITAPFVWVQPSLLDFGALLLLGIVAAIAHMATNRSLAYAPASVVVPYQYSLIVWAVLFGYLFFSDWPQNHVLAGSGIIIGAGLYIFLREQKRAREQESSHV